MWTSGECTFGPSMIKLHLLTVLCLGRLISPEDLWPALSCFISEHFIANKGAWFTQLPVEWWDASLILLRATGE